VSLEVQWFLLLATSQQVITEDAAQQLTAALDAEADLMAVAQAVLDNNLCDDLEKVQALANEAYERAQRGEAPAQPDTAAEAPPEAPSAEPAVAEPVISAGGETGMPRLEDAEALSDAAVRELMMAALAAARAADASDLDVTAGVPPFLRRWQKIESLGTSPLSAAAALKLNTALLSEAQREEFLAAKDLSVGLELENGDRYRVNLIFHKEGVGGTYHIVPNRIRTLAELGFLGHESISKLLDFHNGLILVTGPTGCGKTTTLAAMVQAINEKRNDHIITLEDPIEFTFQCQGCNVTQRQVGRDTDSYASALKGALREDPDIIVIGELHDLETIEMAITAAETGHLVIGTLHTADAASTLNRLLDVFPPAQQPQIRAMTAESLRGVLCQRLVPRADGNGLVVAHALLVSSPAVGKIIREGRTFHLAGVMQTGSSQGMRTMETAFFDLFTKGLITDELALENIKSRDMLNRLKAKQQSLASAPADDDESEAQDQAGAGKKKGWFR